MSERTSEVEYAIRDIILHAKSYAESGKEIIYLNIGDPVRFDFKTPDHIKKALIDAVNNEENYYAESEGLPELKKAVVEKENEKGLSVVEEDVIISNGVSEGLEMVMASVIDPNSEVLMPGPYYPPYSSYVKFYGGRPVEFKLHQNGEIDVEDIVSKITPKSRAICIINPNNPTGEVFDRKNLQKVVDLAAEYDLYLICDEIYDKIVFDDDFTGIGRISRDAPVILLNGFSKSYLMTGWRCGYICLNSDSKRLESLRTNIPKLARVRIASNLPVQVAAVQALHGPQDHIKVMVEKLRRRRDYLIKRLNSIDGIKCVSPKGAFYAFPEIDLGRHWKDDKQFVMDFFDNTGILTVHGSGFGNRYGSNHFRAVYLPPEDILERAMDKLDSFMRRSAANLI